MDLWNNIALGMQVALSPEALLYCFLGVTFGTFIGVLPGIGSLVAISLSLPLTYYLDPTIGLIMIAGIYYGGGYGGSTASILLNLPGKASAAVTCLDGYPMAQQGRAGVALIGTAYASFFGSVVGFLVLILFSPVVSEAAIEFGPVEYFSLVTLGLITAASMSTASTLKSVAMVLVGLMLSVVGTDVATGAPRFNFGMLELRDSLSLVAVAMGLFGVAEVVRSINKEQRPEIHRNITFRNMWPSWQDIKQSIKPMIRGSGIGGFFGALPGTGMDVASFMAYATEVRVAKDKSRFGKGAIEGIMAPEAANNAAALTAFVPTLTLGIPGDAVMALVLGALMIHGINPGPLLMVQNPETFWGLASSFIVGNALLLVLNIPLVGIWIKMLLIPYSILYPFIIIFICFGVFSTSNSPIDVILVAVIGAAGYVMYLLEFPTAPVLLGLVLGPMMEENLRRGLIISRGDFMAFVESPISAVLLALSAGILIWSIRETLKRSKQHE